MGTAAQGFHAGELLVQRRAGVEDDAARLVGMVSAPHVDVRKARWLAEREFAVLCARDADGRLWTVPLLGPAGFLRAGESALTVAALPHPSGPLVRLATGQDVGLIAVEFGTRRRMRVNGRLTSVGPSGLAIEIQQLFGNCPAYIQARTLTVTRPETVAPQDAHAGKELGDVQRALIARADTAFLGTSHPDHGADVSHKGGRPGFVRVDGSGVASELWWPDYAGNNMFNSLGNLSADGHTSLLFLDFAAGTALHLSGTAALEWVAPGSPGDDGGTGRRLRFRPELVVEHDVPVTATAPEFSDQLPALA